MSIMDGTNQIILLSVLLVWLTSHYIVACPVECVCSSQNVNCERKNLRAIPENIPKDVRTLRLPYNSITKITSDDIPNLQLPFLKTLILYNNDINVIEPGVFRDLVNLEELHLQHNNISDLTNETFIGLNNLITLDINHNKLKFLPSEIFADLDNLEELDMRNNQLAFIPCQTFGYLKNLLELDISANPLGELPSCLPVNIKTLKASNIGEEKEITFSYEVLGSLVNLTSLYLEDNGIRDILPGIRFPEAVERLSLNDNYLSILNTDQFQSLLELRDLEVRSNNLTEIPTSALKHLILLELFNANYNLIKSIKNRAFKTNINLKYLYIGYMRLESVALNAFDGLTSLEQLWIQGNNLNTLPDGLLQHFPPQIAIYIFENPWHCDCNLRWLRNLLGTINYGTADEAEPICETPSEHNSQLLRNVKPFDLACPPVIDTRVELNLEAVSGESIEMACLSSGDPPPNITWLTADHYQIQVGSQLNVWPLLTHSNGSLVITNVTESYSGYYTCKAENSGGNAQLRYNLYVIKPLVHTTHLVSIKPTSTNITKLPFYNVVIPVAIVVLILMILPVVLGNVIRLRKKKSLRKENDNHDGNIDQDNYDIIRDIPARPNRAEKMQYNQEQTNDEVPNAASGEVNSCYESSITRPTQSTPKFINHTYFNPTDEHIANVHTYDMTSSDPDHTPNEPSPEPIACVHFQETSFTDPKEAHISGNIGHVYVNTASADENTKQDCSKRSHYATMEGHDKSIGK